MIDAIQALAERIANWKDLIQPCLHTDAQAHFLVRKHLQDCPECIAEMIRESLELSAPSDTVKLIGDIRAFVLSSHVATDRERREAGEKLQRVGEGFALLRQKLDANSSQCQHGWRGANQQESIRDRCPACGGQIFIGKGGWLTCSYLGCPNPGVWRAWQQKLDAMKGAVEVEREACAQLVEAGMKAIPIHGPSQACAAFTLLSIVSAIRARGITRSSP